MTDAIGPLITSIKAIIDLTESLKNARDAAVVRTKVIELEQEILSTQRYAITAQVDQMALLKEKTHLEKEVADLKNWDAEKQKYVLKNLRKDGAGTAWAYVLKDNAGSSKESHYFCPECYQDRRTSILQLKKHAMGGREIYTCHRCKLSLPITGDNI